MTQTLTTPADVSTTNLTAFQKEVLFAVAQLEASEQDSYGLGIKRALEDRLQKNVNHGQLYPNLDELVEVGLLEKSSLDQRTNKYLLTDAGKQLLKEYRQFVDDIVADL
jgi:transcriptional regulator, PadR family